MKVLRFLGKAIVLTMLLAAILPQAGAQGTNTSSTVILGQWDFDTNDLRVATIGLPLQFSGGVEPAYSTATVGTNTGAGVMGFPATEPGHRILATYTNLANGGGTNLNQYTLIMDLMWPASSDGTFRGLFNTDTNNTDDAEIYVDPDNRIGIFNNYALKMESDTWYRLALVYDLTTNGMTRYLNGTNIAAQTLEEGELDGRFSLKGGLLLFADNDFETAPGFVNVVQLRAGAMTEAEVAALGGPGAGGLGQGTGTLPPEPSNVRIESIQREQNEIVLVVSGAGNRRVRLEKSPSIGVPAWTVVAGPEAKSTFRIPLGNERVAFFRAAAVP